jgi:hypothetical protein
VQGDYRFTTDELQISLRAAGDTDDPIATIRLGVMETIGDI